ncbi:hypothetical protein NBO_4g0006 [Nosema bombycis CQ1]|uniref:Uncharacterized protein n=1 Tax=Nosema bombycis (strain CQ1 / CVCC 102059) TaxID=578461 RepID=R0MR80_NOSB1|nr:hypothetical protein NBO_4g0006 [Nosema bombycis CQ1]|eukprot:EOB15378.1 hypothetical protein NBO_4g0006 [Nosema bombycis CQ1]
MDFVEILLNLSFFNNFRHCSCSEHGINQNGKDLRSKKINYQDPSEEIYQFPFESDSLVHFSGLIKISIEQLKILEKFKYELSFISELLNIGEWFIRIPFDQIESLNRDSYFSYLTESINLIDDFKSLLEKRKECFDGPVPISESILNIKYDLNLIHELLPSIRELYTIEERKSNSSDFCKIISELNSLEKLIKELIKDLKNYSGLIIKNNEFFYKKSKIFEYKTKLENESKYLLSKRTWGTNKYRSNNNYLFKELKDIFNDVSRNYLKKESDLLNSIFTTLNNVRVRIERYKRYLTEIKKDRG